MSFGDFSCTLEGYDDPAEILAALEGCLRVLGPQIAAAGMAPQGNAAPPAETPPPARPPAEHNEPADTAPIAGPQIDRLLHETDRAFDQSDSSRRRVSFAHLRAAVATRRAEIKTPERDAGPAAPYRQDLEQASHGVAAPSAQPRGEHFDDGPPSEPAASQQGHEGGVGKPEVTPPAPRPVADPSPGRRMPLPTEILHQAARELTRVEGQPHFSRRQLMAQVKSMAPAAFDREDSLRALGTLLREGKLRRTENGRYQPAPDEP
ncbi:hypothetical protein [Pseudooceanicola algae]|uniref:hypothetical protein n=1 Tax=Pseudooceanicola algae TaxID=1537215 RepID=UPI0018CBB068|nr:hypothetical protein [Pseudooceanicola algae]